MSARGIAQKAWSAMAAPVRWLASFFNPAATETSMKRGTIAVSTIALAWGFCRVVKAAAAAIQAGGHVTMADVALVAVISVPLASLAGAAYILRKDGGVQVGKVEAAPDKEDASEG